MPGPQLFAAPRAACAHLSAELFPVLGLFLPAARALPGPARAIDLLVAAPVEETLFFQVRVRARVRARVRTRAKARVRVRSRRPSSSRRD